MFLVEMFLVVFSFPVISHSNVACRLHDRVRAAAQRTQPRAGSTARCEGRQGLLGDFSGSCVGCTAWSAAWFGDYPHAGRVAAPAAAILPSSRCTNCLKWCCISAFTYDQTFCAVALVIGRPRTFNLRTRLENDWVEQQLWLTHACLSRKKAVSSPCRSPIIRPGVLALYFGSLVTTLWRSRARQPLLRSPRVLQGEAT
jgi:hypothetical protein